MQRCTNCKRRIPEGVKFCGHCGHVTYSATNAQGARPIIPVADCALSVAGFVTSIVNPLLCVISLVLCAVAISKRQARKGLAVTGLIVSLLEIVAVCVLVYLVYFAHVDLTQYIPWLQQQ